VVWIAVSTVPMMTPLHGRLIVHSVATVPPHPPLTARWLTLGRWLSSLNRVLSAHPAEPSSPNRTPPKQSDRAVFARNRKWLLSLDVLSFSRFDTGLNLLARAAERFAQITKSRKLERRGRREIIDVEPIDALVEEHLPDRVPAGTQPGDCQHIPSNYSI
jgi:hypothetical protein